MSLSKELRKCFVCFQPTEKFGKTENTFLSVVMLLRMEGHLPYPPKGSPVLIKDWDPCEPCVPKTLDLYKEYVKLQKNMKERKGRRQRVKGAMKETANTGDKEASSKNSNDIRRNYREEEAKIAADNRKGSSGMRLRKRRHEKARYADPFKTPEEEEGSPKKKKRRRAENEGRDDEQEKFTTKRFKCPRCPSNFKFKCYMTHHIRVVHEKNRPFKCTKCLMKFSSKWHLERHIDRAHGKNGSLKCPHCPSSFQVSRILSRHIQTAHSNKQKIVTLNAEGEEIPQQKGPKTQKDSSLSTDQKTGRDFKCPQCPISFKEKYKLQSHIRVVHEGVRDFRCPNCSKTFTQRRYLRDHVAIVHEESTLHKCPWPNCKSTFANKQTVKLHVASVHEKRRDFKCHICCQGFFRKADCNAHVRNVHKQTR